MASPLARIGNSYFGGVRDLDPRILAVAAATFLFLAARVSAFTFLAIRFTRVIGIEETVVGLAFLTENLLRALVAPLMGALSDRVGRRPVMLGSGVAGAALMPFFLLIDGPASLFAWSAALGIAQSGFFPVSSALLIDLAPPARRQSALALNYTGIALGYTLGVVPAGFLAARSYGLLAGFSSLLFLGVAAIVVVMLRGEVARETLPPRGVVASSVVAFRDPRFLAVAGLGALLPLGIGLVAVVTPVFATDGGLSESLIGVILGINGLVVAALALPVNARVERRGPYAYLVVAGLLVASTYVAYVALPLVPALLVGLTLFSLGEVVFSTALPTAIAALAPKGEQGAYQGAWGMVFAASVGSALFVSGLLHERVGWTGTWLAFAGATALAAVGFALVRARIGGAKQQG